jgi:hypothetical protein
MRIATVPCLLAIVTTSACVGADANRESAQASVVPAAVVCSDADRLEQRAAAGRREAESLAGDHAKTVAGNRANFFAALAAVAALTCRAPLADAGPVLEQALAAARQAETTGSDFARAQRWSDANYLTTQVVHRLIQRLPA